jgi:hypothetical protein
MITSHVFNSDISSSFEYSTEELSKSFDKLQALIDERKEKLMGNMDEMKLVSKSGAHLFISFL